MLRTNNLERSFTNGPVETRVLKGINFHAAQGEFLAIMGRSGAGKSTLLYQLSLLDEPTAGEIVFDGKDTHLMTPEEKTSFRLSQFGFVFQDYALLPELSALDNVVLPLLMQDVEKARAYEMAERALAKVGLSERLNNRPSQLSGGEQQRVSIARAVAHEPKLLFADEPTANLDNESSRIVMAIFKDLHQAGQTIIMVTHEEEYAHQAQKIIRMDDGVIVSITKTEADTH